jgi:uncharacterized lipoprotein YehR (DUF1307 family)
MEMMKNLKKTVAIILVLVMAFAVAGCTKTVKTTSTVAGEVAAVMEKLRSPL